MGKAKDDFGPAASGRRPRSEQRQRTRTLTVRFSEPEADIVRELADRTGLSVGALLRRALLNAPPPPAAHRPNVNIDDINALIAKLETVGAGINQQAKRANMGRFDGGADLREDLHRFADLRLPCLQALGFESDDDNGGGAPLAPPTPKRQP